MLSNTLFVLHQLILHVRWLHIAKLQQSNVEWLYAKIQLNNLNILIFKIFLVFINYTDARANFP